jgi:hypothetical protein
VRRFPGHPFLGEGKDILGIVTLRLLAGTLDAR